MTEKTMIEIARNLATEYHDGMTDKYGNPYMEHLDRVADRVREMEYDFVDETSEVELYIATAYLHDIIEDTAATESTIDAEFPSVIVDAVGKLTRTKGMTYADYIEGMMPSYEILRSDANWFALALSGKIARVVKLSDLLDHVAGPTPCPPNLKKRYEKSLYRLISKGFA